MKQKPTFEVIERHTSKYDEDTRYMTVLVKGEKFFLGVERGKRVHIPYKPARGGQNIGYKWIGFVRNESGREVWSGYVSKGTGVPGLLRDAGLIDREYLVKRGEEVVAQRDTFGAARDICRNAKGYEGCAVWHRGERVYG